MYPFTVWKLYVLTNKINRLYSGNVQTWIEEDPHRTRRTTEILEIVEWVPTYVNLIDFNHDLITEIRHFVDDIESDPPFELLVLQDLHAMVPVLFYVQDIAHDIFIEGFMDEIMTSIQSLFLD